MARGTPLVSCIMPTCNRRRFVGQAIWYFLRQDYPRRELVIVDDGEDAVGDLVPDDARIRYVRLPERQSVGAKRNVACRLSQGELICHWDDDDWMAPNRLRVQVTALRDSGAEVCGTRELLHYRPQAGDAWLYRSMPDDGPSLVGGTLLYRRAGWQAHPFQDRQVGEDTTFVRQFPLDRLHAVADHGFYVAVLHGRNTAAKNLADPRWQRRSLDEVGRLLVLDREFYADLRNGGQVAGLDRRPPGQAITVAASFLIYDGYGSMSEYLVLGMERAGARVDVVPLNLDPAGLSPELLALVHRSRPERGAPTLYVSWLSSEFQRFASAKDLFVNTMWESSRLPAGWPEGLNQASAVIVPTRFVARVCRDSGVTVPIEVVPEGVDPHAYHYEERPRRAGLTTLIVATVVARKHVQEGVAAWKRAFEGDPEARLVIKARFNYGNYQPDDPRIRFVDQNETTRGIAHWYREADVLLALGNEGFGLPLVEGMATGLPVVALHSEGQSDICEDATGLLLPTAPVSWQPCDEPPFGSAGVRGVPGVEEVAARLRWVAGHRDEARELGRAASRWALANRNVWDKGPAVVDVMERHLRPRRPLRRTRTLWTPLWRAVCGVAEYTRHLAQATGAVTTTATTPDLRAVRLLHVQHEPSLFRDADLTRLAQQARVSRIPMIVTEHTVTSQARAWEREAHALVALSEQGVEQLRRRWPGQRVEHIAHGCPTWFPPRKRRRDRVIGAFGFLERHKGFWRLLDVVRQLPDTELVLYSHSKRPAIAAEWDRAARGLPVRREGAFLPIDEVARRLAEQADILVYWYDAPTVLGVSGAVRVGLATGVPVLASPTGWFDDLRDVTYQPASLTEGVSRLLQDTALRQQLTAAAREYCHEHSWRRVGERHLALWQSLDAPPGSR
jgi:glycosyltransferase involved in cell wall biosynthesis